MPTIQDLANLVLEWNEADKVIKENGWDGGEDEAKWESLKSRMVEMSAKVLGKEVE